MSLLKRLLRKSKHFIQRITTSVIECFVGTLAPLIAPIIRIMAHQGVGTNACLRRGFLPMPVHFYSPVPDLKDLEDRGVWDRRSKLDGIDFRTNSQLALLTKLGKEYGNECDWPPNKTSDPYQFFTENSGFSYWCASITHCIIRHFKPHNIIEIGSGNSSLVISQALRKNAEPSLNEATEYIIVDPYPGSIVGNNLSGLTQLVKQRCELVDIDFFKRLGKNDIRFIDSSHMLRIGSDVNYLILEVLPNLASGVIIHLHDISLPFEYPKVYATNPRFRMFWTEAYLLQAFLCLNTKFEILLAMSYLTAEKGEVLRNSFPLYDPDKHILTSGSFWIRRK